MSSSFFPLGMGRWNNRLNNRGYKTWKGEGVNSNKTGFTYSNIRPLTNNDIGNDFQGTFGRPRPIKHYRKGRTYNITIDNSLTTSDKLYISAERNTNRQVKSSYSSMPLITQLIDNPNSYTISSSVNSNNELVINTNNIDGLLVVSNYYPNNTYLTENPQITLNNKIFCCNAEKKAKKRVLSANTNLKQNYYTTLHNYRKNRCQTFEQKSFNFVNASGNSNVNAGSPLLLSNTYTSNCQSNINTYLSTESDIIERILVLLRNESIDIYSDIIQYNVNTIRKLYEYIVSIEDIDNALIAKKIYNEVITNTHNGTEICGPSNYCNSVVYKPNNYQFAKQGAVNSSLRTLQQNVVTINKEVYQQNNSYINLYKKKEPTCNNSNYKHFQNPTICNKN